MLASLPFEVLEKVFDYTGVQDNWSVAAINRQHRDVIKPLLWKKIKLTKKHLLSPQLDRVMLENLQYTQTLDLHATLDKTSSTRRGRKGAL